MASATLYPFSLADCLLRGTEGCRQYLHGFQDRGKHGAGLLPEKPFCRGGTVRAREEEVVHRCQARTLSGMVQSSQLMVPQREVPVAPFHIGTGAMNYPAASCEVSTPQTRKPSWCVQPWPASLAGWIMGCLV